jgi:integral membrane sensor domain MASE1
VTASSKVVVLTTVFGVAYAVIYVICTEINLPLVTYHPVIGEVDVLWTPERRGPAMYWYGWMLTSLIGALALAWLAIIVPEQWVQRAIFFGCTAAVGYLIFYTAALFIYDRATVELEFLKSRPLAVVAALVAAAGISFFASSRWQQRLWPGWIWLVPIGALVVLGYYLTPFFTR